MNYERSIKEETVKMYDNFGTANVSLQPSIPYIPYRNGREIAEGNRRISESDLQKSCVVSGTSGIINTVDMKVINRSVSVFKVGPNGLTRVYKYCSGFETQVLQKHLSFSNNNIEPDNRTGEKGSESETIIINQVECKTIDFVGFEHIGDVFANAVVDPASIQYVFYINNRDYTGDIAGDAAPEETGFIDSDDNVTGRPMPPAANEVSGNVSMYNINCFNDNFYE
ncbi:MAG: choice-of-anchor I domain-containing protein [Eubacteriales bacterium]